MAVRVGIRGNALQEDSMRAEKDKGMTGGFYFLPLVFSLLRSFCSFDL
jgi:hypothetical protein